MKKIFGFSTYLFLTIALFLELGTTSCTKDKTIYDTITVNHTDTVTVNHTDTLIVKDTAISLALITSNAWKMQEIRGVLGNTILFYHRGGSNNTENYDNEYIRFNADKTGVLFDANGATHQITWDFSNDALTKITFIVSNPAPLASQKVIYENLRFKNNALLFDQYWTYNSVNSHVQVIRVASPN